MILILLPLLEIEILGRLIDLVAVCGTAESMLQNHAMHQAITEEVMLGTF